MEVHGEIKSMKKIKEKNRKKKRKLRRRTWRGKRERGKRRGRGVDDGLMRHDNEVRNLVMIAACDNSS